MEYGVSEQVTALQKWRVARHCGFRRVARRKEAKRHFSSAGGEEWDERHPLRPQSQWGCGSSGIRAFAGVRAGGMALIPFLCLPSAWCVGIHSLHLIPTEAGQLRRAAAAASRLWRSRNPPGEEWD
jgi:hypothetical protein